LFSVHSVRNNWFGGRHIADLRFERPTQAAPVSRGKATAKSRRIKTDIPCQHP
jgi:hypothetical protein